jgi:hypothetical protein
MERKIVRKIEEQVTRELLLTANDAGWGCIGYDYGDGFEKDSDYESIVSMCLNVDEIHLVFLSPDKNKKAAVFLVYGNDGWDLINDYTITEGFEQLVMEKINDYCENIDQHLFTA